MKKALSGGAWSEGVTKLASAAERLLGGVWSRGWPSGRGDGGSEGESGSGGGGVGEEPGLLDIVGSAALIRLDTFGRHINVTRRPVSR